MGTYFGTFRWEGIELNGEDVVAFAALPPLRVKTTAAQGQALLEQAGEELLRRLEKAADQVIMEVIKERSGLLE